MRDLLKPRWLAAHALILALAIAFVNLGLWQLRRLDEKRTYNRTLTSRSALPVEPVGELLDGPDDPSAPAAAYRRVSARGTYDTANEIVLLSRARNDIAGNHVVTPLVTAGGIAVLVDRGWVPFRLDSPPVSEAAPPDSEVAVTGTLFPSQTRGRFGPREEGGRLERVFRIDVERLRAQLPYPVYPHWLLLREQVPAPPRELPLSIDAPRLEGGPHLSYAIQWFAFAVVGLTGYAFLVRARVRTRARPPSRATAAPS